MKTLTEQYIIKSRSGVYQDTSENRRKHRVGQHYGEAKKEGEEGKLSKREQREARLASYKKNLATISEAIKNGKIDPSKKEAAEALKAKLEGKITKLEARLNRKGQQKAEEPKKDETNAEAGKRVFESLSEENRAKISNKLKEESERFIKDGMPISQVIGEVEEYRDNNIDFDEEIFDMAHEMGMKDGEVYWAIKHAANLEIKRLEGLEKEAEKKPSDPMSELPERGKSVEFKMDNVDVKIENPTQYASDGKDIYRVTISKDGKQVEQVASAVPATIKKVVEKYGSGSEAEDFEAFAEKFEKNYRRDPNRTVPIKSSEIRELARKEWEKMKAGIENRGSEPDPKTDNYRSATRKKGSHAHRSDYGWKNSGSMEGLERHINKDGISVSDDEDED